MAHAEPIDTSTWARREHFAHYRHRRPTYYAMHVENGWEHYSPVFTLGKYTSQSDRIRMLVALQIHHAAADGFHTARLLNDLRELVATPDWVK